MVLRMVVGIPCIVLLCVTGFGQNKTRLVPLNVSPAMRANEEDLTQKRRIAIKATQQLDKVVAQSSNPASKADPTIAAAQEKVKAAETEANQAAAKVLAQPNPEPAPADKVKELKEEVAEIKRGALKDLTASTNLYQGLTLGGVLLALVGSVFGFLKKAVVAGVLSLCAGAVGGIPRALGIGENAEYSQQLFDGSSSLAFDLQFDLMVTTQDYNGYLQRLQVLSSRSAPGVVKSRQAASELITELIAAKVPHRD